MGDVGFSKRFLLLEKQNASFDKMNVFVQGFAKSVRCFFIFVLRQQSQETKQSGTMADNASRQGQGGEAATETGGAPSPLVPPTATLNVVSDQEEESGSAAADASPATD